MDTSSWSALGSSIFGTPAFVVALFEHVHWLALLIAILVPTLIFLARNEVRLRRLRQLQDFYEIFGDDRKTAGSTNERSGQAASAVGKSELATNPSFEFVRSKYTADLKIPPQVYSDELPERDKLQSLISSAEPGKTIFGARMIISSTGFIILSYFGFHILLSSLYCGFSINNGCVVGFAGTDYLISPMLIIGSLAFAGAYTSAIRTLVGRLAVFDLSSNTFLRITVESFASTLFAMIVFAAFRHPGDLFGAFTPNTSPEVTNDHLLGIWIALAPLFGLIPQSVTKFLLVRSGNFLPWLKTSDDRFVSVTPIVSLDVIEGIDYDFRFRLEDCGIYDVQNLAAYNPIMLHIETPFGIYQCIDWIAQAQLCHIVGLERFLAFRELNIRTIFDLERAIDSVDSPPEIHDMYASILFAPTSNLRRLDGLSGFRFVIGDDRGSRYAAVDEYCMWAREIIGDRNKMSKAIEQLITWITDDLHIRRLRRLWNDIASMLGPTSEYFEDGKRNPKNKSN